MPARPSALAALILLLAAPAAAWAGPVHLVRARTTVAEPRAASVTVDPGLTASEQSSLGRALVRAGFHLAGPQEQAVEVVTLHAISRPLCTSACSVLTGFNVGPLSDHFRHAVVVAARPVTRGRAPLSWYVVLQSDGLSNREADYLPNMLDYGSRLFGRTSG